MKEADVQSRLRVRLHNSTLLLKRDRSLPYKIGTICGEPIPSKHKNGNRYIPCRMDNGVVEQWLIWRLEIID